MLIKNRIYVFAIPCECCWNLNFAISGKFCVYDPFSNPNLRNLILLFVYSNIKNLKLILNFIAIKQLKYNILDIFLFLENFNSQNF